MAGRSKKHQEAFAEREQLEAELATISRRGAEDAEVARAARARVVELKRERKQLLQDAARDLPDAGAKLEANALASREAEAEASEAAERSHAGQAAREVTRRELRRHLTDHIDVFVAANSRATDEVMELRQRAIEAVREAAAAEGPVLAEWGKLANAVSSTPEYEEVSDANTGGTYPLRVPRSLGAPPQSPIGDLAEALATAPRPEPDNLKASRRAHLLPGPLRKALGADA